MTQPSTPVRYVVGRCPRCGVEHDAPEVLVCEACDTALRPWCSRHGREAGWLEGRACPRCADEAHRAARLPPPARLRVRDTLTPAAAPSQVLEPQAPSVVPAARAPRAAERVLKPAGIFWYVVALLLLMMMAVCGGMAGISIALITTSGDPGTVTNFAVGGAIAGGIYGVYYGMRVVRQRTMVPKP